MFYCPKKYIKEIKDINKELATLEGELDDKQARTSLAKFLRRNIGLTTELLTGIKLAPYQIINIKGMLNKNYSLCVWGRGCGKSFCAAIYCILQSIFEADSKIIVAGPTFRTSRLIFNYIEDIIAKKEAKYLFDIMGLTLAKRNDEYRWRVNGGAIIGIPLNGEKIRGFRANILLIDEFLLMSEDLVEKVLMPYLVAPQNIGERIKIREKEDSLIRQGLLKEENRIKFENKAKMIALSSASYKCEYLYRKFEEYAIKINDEKVSDNGVTYFLSQLAWDGIPADMIDKSVIEIAQSNESNSPIFAREYGAQFIDGSDSYFSMNKMMACTIPDGEDTTVLVRGRKDKKYILAIDPNASNSPTSDDFGMCLIELDENLEGATVINQFAKHGKDLKDYIKYFYYLLTNFNIEMICLDNAGGGTFVEASNASELFQNAKLEVNIFEFSPEKEGADLEEQLKNARRVYNKTNNRIAFTQVFTTDFIRKGNEWLQGCIDFKRIWFGAPLRSNGGNFNIAVSANLDLSLLNLSKEGESKGETISDFIDEQEFLIKEVKRQCASIEVKTTPKGTQSFDLPQIMKRDTSPKRQRKDSYTALMLACWGMKQYRDINAVTEERFESFAPFFIG